MRENILNWLKSQQYLTKDITKYYVDNIDNITEQQFEELCKMYQNELIVKDTSKVVE